MTKQEIYNALLETANENKKLIYSLSDKVVINDYKALVRTGSDEGECMEIWTDALNAALREHETVIIPDRAEPYYIDGSIILYGSNRIEAGANAVIRQKKNTKLLMVRNENVIDETYAPASSDSQKDCNISIDGGIWEEMYIKRGGYGQSGMYDSKRSMYGVSTCMLFSNVKNLTLTNMKFKHTAGFSVQIGNAENVYIENIEFIECFADGLHINGNTSKIFIKHIAGQVGDDLLALNMYDWQNSSINFGPMDTVWCEDAELSEDSGYKAIRIEPGVYEFKDGSSVDCSANNIVLKNIRGIKTYKLYLQTAPYDIKNPEIIIPGSGNNIYFEDISVDLTGPIDEFEIYKKSDSVTGSIAAFEIGSNIKNIFFENINVNLYREKFPMSFIAAVGPKSVLHGTSETFDPYVKCTVDCIQFKNITVNGSKVKNINEYVKEITFDRLYDSDYSSGYGKINKIIHE